MTFDAIVIGVGGMGSATAYHLAKRGARVLGIEQFNIGHERGSSHGVTRIIRLAYAEGSGYVPMLRRAYTLWREFQRIAKERLLFITGGIDAGPEDGAIVQGSLQSCRDHGLRYEQLDAAALRRRFPGYRLPAALAAIYQQDAGFVLSERAILAYVAAAHASGAEIHGLERVRSWKIERRARTSLNLRRTYRTGVPENRRLLFGTDDHGVNHRTAAELQSAQTAPSTRRTKNGPCRTTL